MEFKAKFKIGDVVRIKSLKEIQATLNQDNMLLKKGSSYMFNPIDMPKFCGKLSVIRSEFGSKPKTAFYLEISNNYWAEDWLGHPKIKDTKIARKLNKNRIEKIEEGWIYLK